MTTTQFLTIKDLNNEISISWLVHAKYFYLCAQVDLEDGLVCRFQFSNSILDDGPNALSSSIHGGATFTTDRKGIDNSTLLLDGVDDYFKVNDHPSLDFGSNNFTIAIWVKKIESVSSGYDNIFGVNKWNRGGGSPGENEWTFSLGSSNSDDKPAFTLNDGGTNYKVTSPHDLPLNLWYQLTATRTDDQLSLFINGRLIQKINIPAATSVSNVGRDLLLGVSEDRLLNTKAIFDDLIIYNRSLNSEEIQALYIGIITPPEYPENGLVALFEFDGDGDDSSPGALSSIVHGNVTYVEDRNGVEQSAVLLDGLDDYIQIIDDPLLDFGSSEFTIAHWVNKKELVNSSNFDNGFGVNMWFGGIATPGYNEWSLSLGSSANDDKPKFIISEGFSDTHEVTALNDLILNEWYHIAVTRTSNELKLFIDGELVNSIELAENIYISNAGRDLLIGTSGSPSSFTKAAFDDLVIYNRALNDSEINNLSTGIDENACNCTEIYANKIGVGTTNTQGYDLAVAGDIIATEIKVAEVENWPDYVFESDYELRSLKELERYISTHHHLPEMADESKVAEEGIELGEMNAKLLQKIEELTLYLIEEHKQLQLANKKIDLLQEKITQLEAHMEQ